MRSHVITRQTTSTMDCFFSCLTVVPYSLNLCNEKKRILWVSWQQLVQRWESDLIVLNYSLWGGYLAKQPPHSLFSTFSLRNIKNSRWICIRQTTRPLTRSNALTLMADLFIVLASSSANTNTNTKLTNRNQTALSFYLNISGNLYWNQPDNNLSAGNT